MSSANKILTFLLVFSIFVSVGGAFLLIDGILGFSNMSYTGAAIHTTNTAQTGVFSFGNTALVFILMAVIVLTLLIIGLVNRK